MENGVPYLEYLDPGRNQGVGGNKSANRLYPLWKDGNMYWYDPDAAMNLGGNKYTYLITSVCVYPKDQK